MTIKEIAKKAGVSVATVSRVINGDEGVTVKRRDMVQSVIAEHSYVPSELGRHLRKSNTGTILVLLPSMENSFYPSLIKGIDAECEACNYNAIITDTYDSYAKSLEYCEWLNRKLADGIILISPKITHNYAKLEGKCVVGCSDMHPNFPCPQVDIDSRLAAYDATKHLIDIGCRRIAFLGGESASGFSRRDGYCDALKEAGIEYDEALLETKCWSYVDTCNLSEKLLDRVMPDAVFAMSDEFAVAFMHVAEKRGIKVPDDIKVVGFDNIKMSLMTNPELTTMEQPGEEIGRNAVRMLLKKIKGEKQPDKVFFEHKLVIRGSTVKERK